MSWIKTNFLWMMYRSGWGTKIGQEITLAVTIKRTAFDQILPKAVHSKFIPTIYNTIEEWKKSLTNHPLDYNRTQIIILWVENSKDEQFN